MLVRTLALTIAASVLMVPVGASPATAAPDNFTPRPGPTFNNPIKASQRRTIFRRIIRSINSTPRDGEIDIFSWNFLTSQGADTLLRAQRRGVRVRLLMDNRNVQQVDNPSFRRLRSNLHRWNRNHPRQRNSWARTCRGTCRSTKGAAHTKVFMFSRVGRARKVVMQGSANFTEASTTNQWNDIYTHSGNPAVWRFYSRIFSQAVRDRPVHPPYADRSFRNFRQIAFPIRGRRAVDPVMQMLKRVRCQGATNTPSRRTKLQIAPDVIRQDRGMRLARKLRALWNHGCNIRIGYTVVGIDVGRFLRQRSGRGPVPMKHLTQDFNGDGEFDNYFHLKSMTIRGHYGSDRSGFALLNGSANWSNVAANSDENVGIYRDPRRVRRYEDHLDYWYENFPRNGGSRMGTARQVSDDQLIFGSGDNAVYEDGTPLGFDPFANQPLD